MRWIGSLARLCGSPISAAAGAARSAATEVSAQTLARDRLREPGALLVAVSPSIETPKEPSIEKPDAYMFRRGGQTITV
jgi:hypothetical protein